MTTSKPLAQSYICDLTPYQPGLPIEAVARQYGLDPLTVIKLASNENPLGMSPAAQRALSAAMNRLHRYPEQHDLVAALAAHYKLDPEQIVLGNGSNDVLDLIARTFLNDGDEALSAQYAFAVYAIATQSAGASNVVVPATAYGHDLPAMLRAVTSKTRVIWIANPNNPTGTLVPSNEVKQFIEQVPPHIVVVLDEAYAEYLTPEMQLASRDWLDEHANLIVVRTFSKIYGLAGLRVGYGLASAEISGLLNRVRQPFNVSTAGVIAATAALGDTEFVAKSAVHNRAAIEQLQAGLATYRLECLPANGNFVTFETPDAAKLNEFLLRRGIIVRPLAGYGLPDHLRVTAGTPAENKRFLATIESYQTIRDNK